MTTQIPSLPDDLQAIRALLRRGWTKGAHARLSDGMPVAAWDQRAVCWCLQGAIQRVCGPACSLRYDRAWRAIDRAIPGGADMVVWQDHPSITHTQVLAVLDCATPTAA